jgi:hypothetical protein
MTLTDLRDNEALRRELDARYPHGWRVGVDKKDRLVIWYRVPEKPRKAAKVKNEI